VFGAGGAGALAAWMILSGNRDALDPILESIHDLVIELSQGHEEQQVAQTTLWLVLAALGDSLLGGPIAKALNLPRDCSRVVATEAMRARLAAEREEALAKG
jgi:hypothetical protein